MQPPEAAAPQTESKPLMQRPESADILPPAPPPAIHPAGGDSSADDPLPAPPAEMDHISDKLITDLNITSEQPAAPPGVPEVNVETSEKEGSPKATAAESEAKGFSGIFTEGNLAPGNDEMAAAVSFPSSFSSYD